MRAEGESRGGHPATEVVVWSSLFVASVLAVEGISPESVVGGALLGLAVVSLGTAAARQISLRSSRSPESLVRASAIAAAAGIALGAANLGSNVLLALSDHRIAERLTARLARHPSPWETVGAALLEEVVFRLFLMSVIAWIVVRAGKSGNWPFVVSLIVSSLVFSALHLLGRDLTGGGIGALYAFGVVAKSGLLGAGLGALYWRYGLTAAVLAHSLANATHQLLEPYAF